MSLSVEDIKALLQYQQELFEATQLRLVQFLATKLSIQPTQFQMQPSQVRSPESIFGNAKDAGSESTVTAYDEPELRDRLNSGFSLEGQEPIVTKIMNDKDEQNSKVEFGEKLALAKVSEPEQPTKPTATPEMHFNAINPSFMPVSSTPGEENADADQVRLSKRHSDNSVEPRKKPLESADWCTRSYAKLKSDQCVEEEQVNVLTDSEVSDSSEDLEKREVEFYPEEEAQESTTPKRKETIQKFRKKKKWWKSKNF